MKKFISIIIMAFVMIMGISVVGCGSSSTSQLSLTHTKLEMQRLTDTKISAELEGISGDVTWINGDENIIHIESLGDTVQIFAKNAGTTTVTAKVGGAEKSCTVTVMADKNVLSCQILSNKTLEIREGITSQISAQAYFNGAANSKAVLKYRSKNANIATVSDTGNITGVAMGNAIIEVYADYYGVQSNVCEVEVEVKGGPLLHVNTGNVTLSTNQSSATFANSVDLDIYIIDGNDNVSVNTIAITTDDTGAYFIGISNKTIYAERGPGSAVIYIQCEYQGVTYTATVNVTVVTE